MFKWFKSPWIDAVQTILANSPDDFNAYMGIMNFMRKRFGDPIACGSYRAVFDTKDGYIAKVPLSDEGTRDNRLEAIICEKHPLSHYANCQLKRLKGVDVLVMEKLDDILRLSSGMEPEIFDQESDDPYWITRIDGGQVGLSKDGKIKTYDFSRDASGSEYLTAILSDHLEHADNYIVILNFMKAKFGEPIFCGLRRMVFDTNDGFISKVPLGPEGSRDNWIEADLYVRHQLSLFAKCKIKRLEGIDILLMEKLHDIRRLPSGMEQEFFDQKADDPYWITKISGLLIGTSEDGKIKAYDYSGDADDADQTT